MRILSILLLTLVAGFSAKAQIVAIDPGADGGFESDATFILNNWSTVNSANNMWVLSNSAPPFSGLRGAHISTGTGYTYNAAVASASHIFTDVTIPSGSVGLMLTFQWKGNGQVGRDRLMVYTAPTTVTPAPDVPATPSTTIVGATLVWTQSTLSTSYTSASIPLPASLAGTTFRLIFTWQNDNSIGTNPPAAVDDISLTYSCGSPDPISGLPEICIGQNELYSSTTGAGTWSTDNPLVVSVTPSTGNVLGLSAGTATISYTASCLTPATKVVTVHAPPAAIGGSSDICIGGNTSLTNTSTGGTWESSNMSVAPVGSTTGVVSGTAIGTATITYDNVCSMPAFKLVTVHPLPPAITGPTSVCEGGATVSLSNSFPGGTWSVSPTTAASAVTTGPTTGDITGLMAGTAIVSYTSAAGCVVARSMTISPLPPPITGLSPLCVGVQDTLYNTFTGGTWTSSVPGVATITPDNGRLFAVAAGTTIISYSNSCGPATLPVTVYGVPAPIVSADTIVCVGGATTFTNAVLGGTWTSDYPLIASVLPGSGVITGEGLGIGLISYVMPGGCAISKPITVVDVPPAITGPSRVCPGGSITLSNAEAGGTWLSLNPGSASVGAGSGVVSGIFTDTAMILYTTHPGCTVSKIITVDPLPAPIIGRSTYCVGDQDTLYNADPGGVWSSLSSSIATVGNTSGVLTAVSFGTATIRYTLPTSCSITRVFTVNPEPTPVVHFDSSNNTFETGAGYASYQWYHSVFGEVVGATIYKTAGLYNGSYWVVVTDDVGCAGESAHLPYNIVLTVSDVAGSPEVKLYPNPASDVIKIYSDQEVRVVISAIDGKMLMERSNASSINIADLAPGLYLVSIYDKDGERIGNEKLVKE